MYAIVDVKGFQYKVAANELVRVPLLDAEVGQAVTLDRVLMIGGGEPKIGAPTVAGSAVEAEVVRHGRHKKVIVGKFMRRRDYHRKKGHRQDFTELRIKKISAK